MLRIASHICMTSFDDYTPECLAIDVAGSIRSSRVTEGLAQLIRTHGAPHYIRSVNEPEFVSRGLLEWIQEEDIETALVDLGKICRNGAAESFNGKLRDECLSLQWFQTRCEARVEDEN